jgi:hypothetical protein
MIEGKQGGKTRYARVFDQFRATAVENQPAAIEACGEYGMVLAGYRDALAAGVLAT